MSRELGACGVPVLRNLAVQGRVPHIREAEISSRCAVGSVVPRYLIRHFDMVIALAPQCGVVTKDGDQTVGSRAPINVSFPLKSSDS